MQNQFTAVFERDGDWWMAYVEEVPGANTQGATIEEARDNLKDAVALLLQVNRETVELELNGKDVIRETLEVTS
jgi:predicted RNase H-like HicB family nuclease